MTLRISIDRQACSGYGNCVAVAPEVFGLDDEYLAVVRDGHPAAGEDVAVAQAAADCPVQAIRVAPIE